MNLDDILIVLVEPSHPGNIGAVARSMKTMGLTKLALVNPKKFPHIEATNRAAGANRVLEEARVVANVASAIEGCHIVFGTSVRDRQIKWPTVNPKQLAEKVFSTSLEKPTCAILFGRESSGLTNQELDLCHEQIRILANEDYSSLNLASAVQIIAYELRMQWLLTKNDGDRLVKNVAWNKAKIRQMPATQQEKDGHFQHLEETLEILDFIKNKTSDKLMRKLTRLYNKAELTNEEIQILRGILTSIQTMLHSDPDN